MLKGHVFQNQIFESQIFASFANTVARQKSGILDYKEKMQITHTQNTITINSGAALIKGRLVEEDSSTTIGIEPILDFIHVLVIEIDLNKENSDEECNQISYKVISGHYDVNIEQTDIEKSNSGVYQFELARFGTSTYEIIDFKETKNYLNLIEPNEGILFNEDFVMLELSHKSTDNSTTSRKIGYPEGFNKDNTIVVNISQRYYGYASTDMWSFGSNYVDIGNSTISLDDDHIKIDSVRQCDDMRLFLAKKSAITIEQASEVS